ncbi:putative WD repeat-containing protein 75 [Iris pallida]|uniref:WD repeat-containing protein 75 n=1 Tax=Iris pallida TaxID=29817 RepID=A0AAX6HJN5_IRIPA|nr:putative WD repeat-containing protein 75 [Iris pallida]
MAVTSSFGGEFKVWVHYGSIRPKDRKGQAHEKYGWRCQSVGLYKNYMENEGAVNMGGMCFGRICYIFWFYLYNFQFWMFKMYGNYILWLDMFVVGQVLDVCGWTCWMYWKFVVYEQYTVY